MLTPKVKLETYMDHILPGSCVLCKDSGSWNFYLSDTQFENGDEPTFSQDCRESMLQFIERVVRSLMEQEEKDGIEFPDITIDFAIFSKPEYNQ